MDKKQIDSEIGYRLSKWIAFNLLQDELISLDEYQKVCIELLQSYNPPTSCIEKYENKQDREIKESVEE